MSICSMSKKACISMFSMISLSGVVKYEKNRHRSNGHSLVNLMAGGTCALP